MVKPKPQVEPHAHLATRAPDGPRVAPSGTFARAIPRVVLRPDPRLAQSCSVVEPRDPAILGLARALVATMRSVPDGLALAAPQIGVMWRLVCVDVRGHHEARSCAGLVVLANPQIVARAGNVVLRETCRSIPGRNGEVARAAAVIVEGFEPGTGRRVRLNADAIEARCLLHAMDHLDGYLFLDRMLEASASALMHKWYG